MTVTSILPSGQAATLKCKWKLFRLTDESEELIKECTNVEDKDCNNEFPTCKSFEIDNVENGKYRLEMFSSTDSTIEGYFIHSSTLK